MGGGFGEGCYGGWGELRRREVGREGFFVLLAVWEYCWDSEVDDDWGWMEVA